MAYINGNEILFSPIINISGSKTQEKTVEITSNGTTEITPDEGYALSKVTTNVNVPSKDNLILFINGGANMVLTESDLAGLTNPLSSYTFASKTFKSISLPPHITEIGKYILSDSVFETFKTYASTLGNDCFSIITHGNTHIYLLANEFISLGDRLFGFDYDYQNVVINLHFNDESALMSFFTKVVEGNDVMANTSPKNIYYGETLITELNIPPNITKIPQNTFRGLPSIQKIAFEGDITEIRNYSFFKSSSLTEIDFTHCTSVPYLESTWAFNNTSLRQIKVPAALYDEWIAATNWANIAHKIVAV